MPLAQPLRVLVLGGGISGLSFAYYLRRGLRALHRANVPSPRKVELTIAEASPRLGGWIQSEQSSSFLLERGPRSLQFRNGEHTIQLLSQLDMLDSRVLLASPLAQKRYLVSGGQLQQAPGSLSDVLFGGASMFQGLPSALLRELWARDTNLTRVEDESIHDLFARRLGEEWAQRLADPMVAGIYAGLPKQLSVRSCLPGLYELVRDRGGLVRGMLSRVAGRGGAAGGGPGGEGLDAGQHVLNAALDVEIGDEQRTRFRKATMYSFPRGLQELSDALAQDLARDAAGVDDPVHVSVLTQHTAVSAADQGEHVRVSLEDAAGSTSTEPYDAVYSTLEARGLSTLLAGAQSSAASAVRAELDSLPYASVGVVNVAYDDPSVAASFKYPGFGFLCPSQEKTDILGVTFDSCIFPEQQASPDHMRFTVMMGGTRRPDLLELPEAELEVIAVDNLRRFLGIEVEPALVSARKVHRAILQYPVGYHAQLEAMKRGLHDIHPRLILGGPLAKGVSVNDCIVSSKNAAKALATELSAL